MFVTVLLVRQPAYSKLILCDDPDPESEKDPEEGMNSNKCVYKFIYVICHGNQ